LPEGIERDKRELELRMTLGPALMATRGHASPEAEVCYLRAGELRRALGESMPVGGIAQLAPILHGLWAINIVRARHATAMAFAQQVLQDGESIGDDSLQVQGNMETGWAHFFQGRPAQARASLEASMALYDHSRHAVNAYVFSENPCVSAGVCLAETYWLLGYPDQAQRCSEDTLAMLEVVDHPYSAAFAHVIAAFLRQYLGDPSATRALADKSIAVAAPAGMELLRAMAETVRGWALTWEGALDEGIAQMRSGLAPHLATGAELLRPYFFWMLGDALRRAGQTDEALALVDQADAAIRGSDECYLEAEVHRLRGQLLLQTDPTDATSAEAAFQRALEVAQAQEARSLELRAAVCLALLWHNQGRTEEARDLLLPIYDWFIEGHQTPDLIEARTLLEQCDAALEDTGASTLRGGR
jgi:predicted ATPase